jgi:hypothetical protein
MEVLVGKIVIGAALLALSVVGVASANPVVVQPDEAASSDTFIYQFLPTFNFETSGPGFQALLSSGETGTGHATKSLIQFDLTGVSISPGESAYLWLYVRDTTTTGFGQNPSSGFPVTANVAAVTSAWTEISVNWGNPPAAGGTIASASIDGINKWVAFDVTSTVEGWLVNPSTNFGFVISQPSAVLNGGPVVAVYDSASGGNHPALIVPEPASMGLLAVGAAALLARRRRLG